MLMARASERSPKVESQMKTKTAVCGKQMILHCGNSAQHNSESESRGGVPWTWLVCPSRSPSVSRYSFALGQSALNRLTGPS